MSGEGLGTLRSESIGVSHQGRPLTVYYLGGAQAQLRILFLCGQHGDEPAVRRHIRRFLEQRGAELQRVMPALSLAVLMDANPDGSTARTRANAQGIDLNRDHVRLQAPETRHLHEFIRQWHPHLVVDFHNYPSRRRHLLDQRLRLGWDVALDVPTNPAAGCRLDEGPLSGLFEGLSRQARRGGYLFGRYGIYGKDGSFRHGTPQLGDARNTITLRYETPTLLVEARNPSRRNLPEDRQLLPAAVAATAWEICAWAMREAGYLWNFRLPAEAGARVPLSFRRQAVAGTLVPVRDIESGAWGALAPARDLSRVDGRRHRRLPASYRVVDTEALNLLARQGYRLEPPLDGFGHYRDVAVDQPGGRMLTLLLDERSRYRAWQKKKEASRRSVNE